MSVEKVETLIIGGGQAGLAMSAHLRKRGLAHLVLERDRIAESWRSRRWDSLVANGPAWHDRFPDLMFEDLDPDSFATKDRIVAYMEEFARRIESPIRCGVEVQSVCRAADGASFQVNTSQGIFEAAKVVVATGPFQKPVFPDLLPVDSGMVQIHSNAYKNPQQLPEGAVLVVGAGSSGAQIAEELMRAGRKVYLAVGPHNRPPRRYRGRDFVWWLGALGKWDMKTPAPGSEHVTIAVSGANGGFTVDFRRYAEMGMTLTGKVIGFANGRVQFAEDLATNIRDGDADYLSVLNEADSYIAREGLDFPEEPEARQIPPDPACMINPLLELDLAAAGVTAVVWATGFALDMGWLQVPAFDQQGRPDHTDGVSTVPGLYFLGLPWLVRRASPFIWGVWHDAAGIAKHIEQAGSEQQVSAFL
ncbi:monooxygenase FAD-binding protein [Sphingobium chlorophenolicum L-1]|uniref:Monooxygenase FAD-binding protein n=1 Tax=Sphingobium chlorophenolicum L-1 TaxID=690566 RepID=F6ETP0_SPHCR|nr:NAD(P)/FAD-dependent oxidoreductase [Sphingobium chlorophenolicum]AEG49535.1 monooxygenase FAD-binding protein [Sphingobium chlorophenolicum L-1]